MRRVCVVGLWHLGLVSAAGVADLGHEVVGVDRDKELIAGLRKGKLPLFEPGLAELVTKHFGSGQLRFEEDLGRAVSNAETVLITYDTPVDEEDRVDLTLLEEAFRAIIPSLAAEALVLVNSQVPVGSTERWQRMIDESRPEAGIDVIYSPENLRLGQALELFKRPDMIVIGSNTERARKKAEKFFEVFPVEKFFVSWRTAEMAKHALNVFFATSISFANEMGSLCDRVGADGVEIAKILKQDGRIGKKAQVRPGLGFAGATLARDLRSLQDLGKHLAVATPLVDSVLEINSAQLARAVAIVEQYFDGQLKGKTFAALGLTYKPGTSTLRRSASLEILRILHAKGAHLRAQDPKADLSEYSGELFFEFSRDPYEAVRGAHGLLLLTEWPEYRELDFARIKQAMIHPFVLDAKNHLEREKLKGLGFHYFEIGRGQLRERVVQ